jgi:hypothetical protein
VLPSGKFYGSRWICRAPNNSVPDRVRRCSTFAPLYAMPDPFTGPKLTKLRVQFWPKWQGWIVSIGPISDMRSVWKRQRACIGTMRGRGCDANIWRGAQ